MYKLSKRFVNKHMFSRFKTHRGLLAVSPLAILDVGLDVAGPLPVVPGLRLGDLQAALIVIIRALKVEI